LDTKAFPTTNVIPEQPSHKSSWSEKPFSEGTA